MTSPHRRPIYTFCVKATSEICPESIHFSPSLGHFLAQGTNISYLCYCNSLLNGLTFFHTCLSLNPHSAGVILPLSASGHPVASWPTLRACLNPPVPSFWFLTPTLCLHPLIHHIPAIRLSFLFLSTNPFPLQGACTPWPSAWNVLVQSLHGWLLHMAWVKLPPPQRVFLPSLSNLNIQSQKIILFLIEF